MKLGEQIEITGFDDIEPALLVVVKKMIGNQIKELSEKNEGFENIKIMLKGSKEEGYEIEGSLMMNKKENKGSVKNSNLFFAINALFEELQKSL